MRILLISFDFRQRIGGQLKEAVLLSKGLRQEHEVVIVTERGFGIVEDDVHGLIRHPLNLPFNLGSLTAFLSALEISRKLGGEFDLILSIDCNISMFTAAWINVLTGIPFATIINGLDFYSWANPRGGLNPVRLLLRHLLKRAVVLLPISSYTKKVVEYCGVKARTQIIPPPVDVDRFMDMVVDEEARREYYGALILSVGRLVERKGVDLVLKALSGVKQDYTYIIVGDGPQRKSLEELAKQLGISGKVVFTGEVSDEDLVQYYGLCDFFVLTPYEIPESGDYEGFGIVYVEANAAGKPVIASDSGGIPDAVSDGVSGLLVKEKNVVELREAIGKLITDQKLYNRLRDNTVSWARQFSAEKCVRKHLELFDSVLTGSEDE